MEIDDVTYSHAQGTGSRTLPPNSLPLPPPPQKPNLRLLKTLIQNGNSLAVQWLGLCASTARGPDLIPGWETNPSSHVVRP